MSETVSETAIIQSLDFEPEIGCEGIGSEMECAAAADWVIRCRSCKGLARMLCDRHVQELRASSKRFDLTECRGCHFARPTWDEVVELFPVRTRR
jgi:hypothetical protein